MSTHAPTPADVPTLPATARVAIAAARFNAHLVDQLLDGCTRRLGTLHLPPSQISIHRVPGAFELPLAAKWLAETGDFAAVICLGAVVRGDTPHFEYVAGECAHGLSAVSLSTGVPVIFGVLTTNTEQQALERLGGTHGHAGERTADAAAEMIALRRQIGR